MKKRKNKLKTKTNQKKYERYDSVLALFALRSYYLKTFTYQLKKSCECEFAEYIRKKIEPNKIMEIDNLHLECCFADNLHIVIV